jgi:phosphoglycerate dehydrogenase-like enzyme
LITCAGMLFLVGLSADFLDDAGQPVFPDLGIADLENKKGLEHRFLDEYLPEYVSGQLQGLDVLISLKPRVSAASLEENERLTAIGRCGVGYDNVDLAACTERDIAVYITPSAVIRPMAESAVLLVLALSHNLVRKDRLMRRGKLAESTRPLGREPRGRVIGSIGFGGIARETLRLLRVFDPARMLTCDPAVSAETASAAGVELVSLEQVLRESDYVLINCPLLPETRDLIGEKELRLMKRDSVLVNAARGPIVNEPALIEALREGRIRGAALDVYAQEPLPADSPLLELENVILTSHSVGWTEELFRDMGREDCAGALAVFSGEPPRNVVNRDVLARPGFLRKLAGYRERFA